MGNSTSMDELLLWELSGNLINNFGTRMDLIT
jgi:hypothetical protein